MMDSLFADGLEADIDRLSEENRLIAAAAVSDRRLIQSMVIRPSEDLAAVAVRHVNLAPRSLRALLRTTGAAGAAGSALLSYLMFEGAYTRELIAMGHADAMRRRSELQSFLCSDV
jgi:NTE family protein